MLEQLVPLVHPLIAISLLDHRVQRRCQQKHFVGIVVVDPSPLAPMSSECSHGTALSPYRGPPSSWRPLRSGLTEPCCREGSPHEHAFPGPAHHHLKALKLPTFLREYHKVARQCARREWTTRASYFHPALGSTPSRSCRVEKSPQTKRIVQQIFDKSLITVCFFSALRPAT
jgi:hypothetical protein